MKNGKSVSTSGTGKKVLSLSKTMLNWSTLKTFLKNSGQWAQNVMKLIVLFATQLKFPALALNYYLPLLRN